MEGLAKLLIQEIPDNVIEYYYDSCMERLFGSDFLNICKEYKSLHFKHKDIFLTYLLFESVDQVNYFFGGGTYTENDFIENLYKRVYTRKDIFRK